MSDVKWKSSKQRGPWSITNQNQAKKSADNHNLKKSELKFKEATTKFQAAAEKHAKDYDSSSEEEDLESKNVIDGIFKFYTQKGQEIENLGRTKGYVEDSFISGAITCLICISSVKRNDEIWNCSECYCSFHLECIQRWSKDSIVQKKNVLEGQIITKQIKLVWCCPKCRREYLPEDTPTHYTCFCTKTINPKFQSLLIPHSCGEKCGKQLKPICGHECLLLCHPGPCPPCPITISSKCYCGSNPPKLQRCCNKEWSCGSKCNKLLTCDKHKCSELCHAGDCKPCPKKSIQKCLCGTSQKLRDCSTPIWQCEKICNKALTCGFHSCPEICHFGDCGECELSKVRTCPCGKSNYNLPCTEETPTCEDTCGKLLECEQHFCNYKCHKDKCGSCVEIVIKSCRCGLHTKEIPCKKRYLCETKCKQMKDCNKHPCNRKCCDGNCPPCEKPCGRTLSCGNHKCGSVCHRGPCYPCQLTEKVFCRCNETFITVSCGRKHKTRPPRCNKLCQIPPDCHHVKRNEHKCHFGDCPPCRQICDKQHNCGHKCPKICHSAVLVTLESKKASMPWEQTAPQVEMQALPCPDCKVPVPITCLGEHETADWPCSIARPSSCGRPCGRLLSCGNHTCTKSCHTILNAPDKINAGEDCENCYNPCTKTRPEGCSHTCPKPCHPGNCPPCNQMFRVKCHCGLNQPYVACKEWIIEENKEKLQSCGDQCPNNYPCGHRCRSNCHPGPCVNSELCKKKIKVTCPCKRIKKEFSCENVRNGSAVVNCDDVCNEKKAEAEQLKATEIEQMKKEEAIKNRKELEKYEKMFHGKKKYKEKKVRNEIDERGFFSRFGIHIFGVLVGLIACFYMFVILK
ncbi:NF-X1-type zinc finger protein NFXL1 [Onthophagus taurus]|uniref:NF-X1-type zinc finger protein NFXL1 n=1 Tax=Onthophagus taurus TaxID=166361 RepID=UPI000C20352F|nr:NF-X1-type zinc finger protein NFXL1 isoform X1 [Onthophagus taurus]XP_022903190.1 NF-X1-type zinc finger protein NFXL1 isoform X2 [Onthophagus taurus]